MSNSRQTTDKLLEFVPVDGAIGNLSLRRQLGWDADIYWKLRDELIDSGVLEKSKGKGGAVRRVLLDQGELGAGESTEQAVAEESARIRAERALYNPMKSVIEAEWARERRIKPIVVSITATQGSRQTGGKWSRPDIVSVSVQEFPHLPGKFIEVITFEVKTHANIDVTAVYEALAHRRTATHSYVLLHTPEPDAPSMKEDIGEICQVAKSHDIGVIVVADPSNFETWDEREVAGRVEPDPAKLDEFITTQLRNDERRIAEAVR